MTEFDSALMLCSYSRHLADPLSSGPFFSQQRFFFTFVAANEPDDGSGSNGLS
jgi:hypothetical protein